MLYIMIYLPFQDKMSSESLPEWLELVTRVDEEEARVRVGGPEGLKKPSWKLGGPSLLMESDEA